jgi:hypothetical protein
MGVTPAYKISRFHQESLEELRQLSLPAAGLAKLGHGHSDAWRQWFTRSLREARQYFNARKAAGDVCWLWRYDIAGRPTWDLVVRCLNGAKWWTSAIVVLAEYEGHDTPEEEEPTAYPVGDERRPMELDWYPTDKDYLAPLDDYLRKGLPGTTDEQIREFLGALSDWLFVYAQAVKEGGDPDTGDVLENLVDTLRDGAP